MITHYYYQGQIKDYIKQFLSIFSGLHVATGIGQDGNIDFLRVPVMYGSVDRVVAALTSRNTTNLPIKIPMMSGMLMGLDIAPERATGAGMTDRRVVFATGGVLPDDAKVIERLVPYPYDMTMELAIYASNSDQMFQILEQVLILFDPTLTLSRGDDPFDWNRLSTVELMSIQSEENYPIGTDKRIIVYTLSFAMKVKMGINGSFRDEVVNRVNIDFGDMQNINFQQFGDNGEPEPFDADYGSLTTG